MVALGLPGKAPKTVWSSNQISDFSLPPLHTLLFGAFKVVDIWHVQTDQDESGVDLAFGSDSGTFAGCHRLSVATVEEREESSAYLAFSCMTCNPTEGEKGSWTKRFPFMLKVHNMYSELLFRAAVGNVIWKMEEEGGKLCIAT